MQAERLNVFIYIFYISLLLTLRQTKDELPIGVARLNDCKGAV